MKKHKRKRCKPAVTSEKLIGMWPMHPWFAWRIKLIPFNLMGYRPSGMMTEPERPSDYVLNVSGIKGL